MSSDSIEIESDRNLRLLDELQNLLDKQVNLVRKNHFVESEVLLEQSGALVAELSQMDMTDQGELKEKFERLVKSYRTVIFSVAAEKGRIENQLQQVNQGRKTLRTYSGQG